MIWLSENTEVVLAVLGTFVGLLAFLNIVSYVEFRKARRMYRTFMIGVDKQNLESGLLELMGRIVRLEEDRDSHRRQLQDLERSLVYTTQRVGMVRFNAFNDAGGELSFALAMLDGEGTGIVISSIYGRAEARVYAKPVTKGQSSYALSKEEEQAIARSQGSRM